jgi:NitT/TauT family transport system permease protein
MTSRSAVQRPGAVRSLIERILPPMVLGSGFVGVWYLLSYGLLEPRRRFLLRPPHEVVQVGFLTFSYPYGPAPRWP